MLCISYIVHLPKALTIIKIAPKKWGWQLSTSITFSSPVAGKLDKVYIACG